MQPIHTLVARDLMSADVASVDADSSVRDCARFLDDNRIHGAPVVNVAGALCGVVSMTDIMHVIASEGHYSMPQTWFGALDADDSEARLRAPEGSLPKDVTVAQIMSHELVTVYENAEIRQVARVMLDEGVQRVIVLSLKDHVCGILSLSDLLRLLAR